MRQLFVLAATCCALIGAGAAYAHDGGGGLAVKSVGATFTATTASNVRSSTCTGTDGGTYTDTRATYAGTASSSEATLNGPLTITATSFINTTSGVGYVDGKIAVASSSGTTNADFDAVYSNGTVTGFAKGNGHSVALLANVSAGFNPTGGFTSGQIGGSAGGAAIELGSQACQAAAPAQQEMIEVHGTVSAVSSSSITAAGVTCAVPAALQTNVATFHVGDSVYVECSYANGVATLDNIAQGGTFHGKLVVHCHANSGQRTAFLRNFKTHYGRHHR